MFVLGLYQPAAYRQRDDGKFEVVDQSDSEKVSSGVCCLKHCSSTCWPPMAPAGPMDPFGPPEPRPGAVPSVPEGSASALQREGRWDAVPAVAVVPPCPAVSRLHRRYTWTHCDQLSHMLSDWLLYCGQWPQHCQNSTDSVVFSPRCSELLVRHGVWHQVQLLPTTGEPKWHYSTQPPGDP